MLIIGDLAVCDEPWNTVFVEGSFFPIAIVIVSIAIAFGASFAFPTHFVALLVEDFGHQNLASTVAPGDLPNLAGIVAFVFGFGVLILYVVENALLYLLPCLFVYKRLALQSYIAWGVVVYFV